MQRFSAQRFRNLHDLEMTPAARMNVIYGENAQGKTNLLEAVYVLSTLRSFRTRQLPETLQFGENNLLLQGVVQSGHSNHALVVALQNGERVALLDRKRVDAFDYLGAFNVFLFSFPLLEVVRGGPEERRKFFDRSIAISKPGYLPELMQLHRTIKQKNALLLTLQRGEIGKKEGAEELRSFNEQLVQHGVAVTEQRRSYLTRLTELLHEKQRLFFDPEARLGMEIQSSFRTAEEFRRNLERNLENEVARGISLVGPHRDEVKLTVNGKELRKYGSSGQHRAFLLLVLLAQLSLYERMRADQPVLLLDDLDSELDQAKIERFLTEIRDRYQTFVGSSRHELFSGQPDARLYEIRAGILQEM
ncbi:MAG TPA: DNA replication and repair protein RecF [Acidobacteriota bacterium]|nr:DNA replication and repair protein RecF [Acidobacteriota bacterium]